MRYVMFMDLEKSITVKISTFPKLIYMFKVMPTKVSIETDKKILKFLWKYKGHKMVKILLKKNKVGRLTLPNFKT